MSIICAVFFSFFVMVQGIPAFCKYNMIVLNDADISQDIEGELFVGGNVNSRYATLAMKLENSAKLSVTVTVAGDFKGGANINAGSVIIGGSSVQKNGEKIYLNSKGNIMTGVKEHIDKDSVNNEILALSEFYRKLPSNGGTIPTPNRNGQPQGVNIVANGYGRVVLDVDGTDLFSNPNVQQIGFSIGSAVTAVIVNVKGTSINFNQGNFVGDVNKVKTNLIWNFYEALTLDTGNKIFEGSVLAPRASLTNGSPIEGSVAVSSYTQGGEIHLPKTVVCDDVQPITPTFPTTTTTTTTNSEANNTPLETSNAEINNIPPQTEVDNTPPTGGYPARGSHWNRARAEETRASLEQVRQESPRRGPQKN